MQAVCAQTGDGGCNLICTVTADGGAEAKNAQPAEGMPRRCFK